MAKPKKKNLVDEQTGRSERRTLMKRLAKYQKGSNIPGYQEYVEKMTKLDAMMEKYSARNSFGAAETMDIKAKEAMLKAMQETALAGEVYLKNAKAAKDAGELESLKKGVPLVVNHLQGMLSRDQEALETYDPAVPRSLPQVLAEARSSIVILDQGEMKKLGGAQSTRIPITFKDKNGQEHRGMFTKLTVSEDHDQWVNDTLEKAAKQCYGKEGQDCIRNMVKNYRERHKDRLKDTSDTQVFHELSKELMEKDTRRIVLNKAAVHEKLGVAPGVLGFEGIKAIGEAFLAYERKTNQELGLYMNGGMLGMEKDARIDSRNSAMSSVAKLLGSPGLLAKSVNMKFVGTDGQVQEGTFMDYAEGVDLGNSNEATKAVNERPFDGATSWKGLKQLADLQVLDYICGNVDRHQGNLMYKTDELGNVVGVQGIDNDSSFGRFAEKGKNKHLLPGSDHLNVISASMRKKVMGLTPEMLKYALRGRGLSEEEMEFAAKRLLNLQASIREGDEYYKNHPTKNAYEPGHLRTVMDKEFQKLKISQLHRQGEVNLFRAVDIKIHEFIRDDKARGMAFDPKAAEELGKKKLPVVDTIGRGFTGGNLREALQGASKLVEDKEKKFKISSLTSKLHGSSPEWDEMEKAAKKVAKMEQELLENPYISISQYNARRAEINAAVEALGQKNDAYLEKKMGEKKVDDPAQLVGKNDYEKARIAHSLKIKAFTDAYKQPRELTEQDTRKLTEGDKLEIRLADEMQTMQEQQKAFKMLQEIHRKHHLDAPEKMKADRDKLRSVKLNEEEKVEEPVVEGP